jgi:hypothetical protein
MPKRKSKLRRGGGAGAEAGTENVARPLVDEQPRAEEKQRLNLEQAKSKLLKELETLQEGIAQVDRAFDVSKGKLAKMLEESPSVADDKKRAGKGHDKMMEEQIRAGETPMCPVESICKACISGDIACLRRWAKSGFRFVGGDSSIPAWAASTHGHIEVLRVLVKDLGANINHVKTKSPVYGEFVTTAKFVATRTFTATADIYTLNNLCLTTVACIQCCRTVCLSHSYQRF